MHATDTKTIIIKSKNKILSECVHRTKVHIKNSQNLLISTTCTVPLQWHVWLEDPVQMAQQSN